MKITKRAINSALPSLTWFRHWYRPAGSSGIFHDFVKTLANVIVRVDDNGVVEINVYGVGEAYLPRDYNMEGKCINVVDLIERWLDRRCEDTRRDIIDEIHSRLIQDKEDRVND